ncbi:hypothetical protein [Allobaculum sp. Allo2]|nr:hypothetical protein [Allobaculum sp. Allo2]UNT94018.1 hypothetical protein KWG61_05000 [Allobaculum sp. Allo2]
MEYIDFVAPARENEKNEAEQISIDQGLHMVYEFADFEKAISSHDEKAYEKYKEETLAALSVLEEARAQMNARK